MFNSRSVQFNMRARLVLSALMFSSSGARHLSPALRRGRVRARLGTHGGGRSHGLGGQVLGAGAAQIGREGGRELTRELGGGVRGAEAAGDERIDGGDVHGRWGVRMRTQGRRI